VIPDEGRKGMKCPSCGADNPDYTFYCGSCARELPRQARQADAKNDGAPPTTIEAKDEASSQDGTAANMSENALVAIAVNVRRLFLVVFSSLSTSMMTIMIVNDDFSISSTSLFISAFMGIAVVIAIAGIVYIVYGKRLTTL
jgi:hypothetical protein